MHKVKKFLIHIIDAFDATASIPDFAPKLWKAIGGEIDVIAGIAKQTEKDLSNEKYKESIQDFGVRL